MALWLVWLARNFDVSAFDCRLHKELGNQFAAQGKPASAELHFREALWRQPDDPVTFVRLGDATLHDPRLTPGQARAEARLDYRPPGMGAGFIGNSETIARNGQEGALELSEKCGASHPGCRSVRHPCLT